MVLIHANRDIPASLDSVWNVIADIDREPEFWHGTKSIRNISRQDVTKLVTQDNETFIKLTRNGEEKCMEDLESLLILVEHFHSHPELQDKHVLNEGPSYVSKGLKPKTSLTSDLENTVDDLIRRISDWS